MTVDVDELSSTTPEPDGRTPVRASPLERLKGLFRVTSGPAAPLLILFGLNVVDEFDRLAFATLTPEIRDAFDLSDSGIVAIGSMSSILVLFLTVPLGIIADRENRVRLVRWAAIIWATMSVLTGVAWAIPLLFVGRLFGGIAKATNEVVHTTLLADYYKAFEHPRVFQTHRLANSVGSIASLLAAGLAIVVNWRAAFIVLAIPTYLLIASTKRLREPARGESMNALAATVAAERSTPRQAFRRVVGLRTIRRMMAAVFVLGISLIALAPILTLFFEKVYGFGPAGRGVTNFLLGAGTAIGLVVGGNIGTRVFSRAEGVKDLATVMAGAIGVYGIGLVGLALAPWWWLSISALTITAIAIGVATLAMTPLLIRVIPPDVRAQGNSYGTVAIALGAIFGIPLAGLGDSMGYRPAVVVLAVITMVGALVMLTARWSVLEDVQKTDTEFLERLQRAQTASAGAGSVDSVEPEDVERETGAQPGQPSGAHLVTRRLLVADGRSDPAADRAQPDAGDPEMAALTDQDTSRTGRLSQLPLPTSRIGRTSVWVIGGLVAWLLASSLLPKGLPTGVLLLGTVEGALAALTAIALVIVYRSARIINFAQAEIGGLAATLAILLVIRRDFSYPLAIVLGMIVAIATGWLVDVAIVRRFFKAPRLILGVATIGLAQVVAAGSLALGELIPEEEGFFSSASERSSGFGAPWDVHFTLGAIKFDADSIIILLVVPIVLAGLVWFFARTDNGIGARAAADSQDRALLLGIPVRRLSALTWMLAAGLSGLAAMLNAGLLGQTSILGGISGVTGPELLMVPLAAAVIAKFDSLPVAVVASIGLKIFAQATYWNYPRSTTVDLGLFAVILVALLVQRRSSARVAGEDLGGFVAVQQIRRAPDAIWRLPEAGGARRVLVVALAGLVIGVPYLASNSQAIIFSFAVIYAIVGVSLVVLTGWAGQVTLGQFAFVGIGAATTGALVEHAHVDLLLALLGSALVGGVVALVVGAPALRIPGMFLAPLTLAFAVAVGSFVLNTTYFPTLNPVQIGRPHLLDRFDLAAPKTFYYFCLAWLAIVVVLVRNFRQSRVGRAVIGVRDNERMAATMSIAPTRLKLTAFALSGAAAGLAGGLYVLAVYGIPINGFGAIMSLQVFSMVVVGGLASITGGILGAVYVYSAQYFVKGAAQLFVTGAGILVVLLVMPGGLAALIYSIRDRALRWVLRRRGLSVSGWHVAKASFDNEEQEGSGSATMEGLRLRAERVLDNPSESLNRTQWLYQTRPWLAQRAVRGPLQARYRASVRRTGILSLVSAFIGLVGIKTAGGLALILAGVVLGVAWLRLRRPSGRDRFRASAEKLAQHVERYELTVATGRDWPAPSGASTLALATIISVLFALLAIASGWQPLPVAVLAVVLGTAIGLADRVLQRQAMTPDAVLNLIDLRGPVHHEPSVESRSPVDAEAHASDNPLLVFDNVDAYYGHLQVLFGINAQVVEGEILAMLGTNGAGKSTLLRVAAGLLKPAQGRVLLDGEDITDDGPIERVLRGIVVVQAKAIFGSLTVRNNLRLAGWLSRRRGDTADLEAATERVFDLFPVLRERLDQRSSLLSGGEQQMLTLAQGMLCKPRVLLVDELSLGLAPVLVAQIMEAIRALRDSGVTVVVVEQSLNLSTAMASQAMFIEKGQVRFRGTPEELHRSDLLRSVFVENATPRARVTSPASREPGAVTAAPDEMILRAVDVNKSFGGVTAVKGFNIEVRRGDVFGIIGANGAGKTTVFDIMSGLLRPDSGKLFLRGIDISDSPAYARAALGLGRTFQDVRMMPSLTTREQIAVALERHIRVREPLANLLGVGEAVASERSLMRSADELLEAFGLTDFAEVFVADLSTGTRRVVELACVAGHEPAVLLLDEPTSGLAQRETEAMAERLLDIKDRTGATLVLIEHDVPLVAALSDEVACMHLGEVISRGTPTQVLSDPTVISAYLGTDEAAIGRSDLSRASNGSAEHERWLTTAELAALAGVTAQEIRKRIKSGEIAAERNGRGYHIPASEAEHLLAGVGGSSN